MAADHEGLADRTARSRASYICAQVTAYLAAAVGAVAGLAAGAGVVAGSRWLAKGEELEVGGGALVMLGPPALCALALGLIGFAYRSDPAGMVIHAAFAVVLVQVIFFDLEHGLILDRVIYPAALFALAVSVFRQPWWAGIATGLAVGAAFLLLGAVGTWLARAEALGLGDVKLAACIGLFLAPQLTFEAMLIAFASAGVAAVGIAVWRRSLAGRLALGPYLAVGALIAMYPLR